MEFGVFDTLNLLGSLGLFLIGMKIMSDALMELAGNRMRRIMAELTANRFKGMATGLFITGLIQSSSSTTLMVVSFVNAGLLNLTEALGVIMGANIGTTLTAWLIAVLGFKVAMSDIALPLMILGFLLFVRKDKQLQSLGGFIVGFSLLFIGLDFMKEAVPGLQSNPIVYEFIQSVTDMGNWSLLLFLVIGTLLTLVLQSSSATMAITLVAVSQGWLPFEAACAIVLGENVGTTITANLAAFVANTNAKRAALSHMVFNIIGVTWVVILFAPFLALVRMIVNSLPGESTSTIDLTVGLAVFHTTFNIVNTLLLIGFIGPIATLVTRLISETDEPKPEIDEPLYLNKKLLAYPETSLKALFDETEHLYRAPMNEVIMHGINLHRHDLEGAKSLDDLVANSRAIISMNFDDFVEKHIRPIYNAIINYGSEVHQRLSLGEQEEEQFRLISYAARDSLLIAGKVAQYNHELNRYMDSPNKVVRDSFDQQRKSIVQFLQKLHDIDLDNTQEDIDQQLEDLGDWTKKREHKLTRLIGELINARTIDTTAVAALYASSRIFRSICQDLIWVFKNLNTSRSHAEGKSELEDLAT
jgi:phosphate:Na+ symporter